MNEAPTDDLIERLEMWSGYSDAHPDVPYTSEWAVELLHEVIAKMDDYGNLRWPLNVAS